ncbi:DUF4358 domain-containing protein [Clostridium sp. Sa3CUN1]|uniref:DUF4358 domain-containing protein n=1 Tax=Clostridium gallinarum TaxID=2762246 RepID=A0ABR8Q8B5_9CLOT|nr:DUF4358 domain-containing protein [Clostridium gallinarum]MBD7916494.1 DUF4358 domain-containing protein [Clostridium gallinarum]
MKIITKILCGMLVCASLVACGSKSPSLKEGISVKDVVNNVVEKAPMQMPMELDDTTVSDLTTINLDDVEEYAITKAMIMNSADITAIVKAKDGKVESVKAALQEMLDTEKNNAYLPDQKEKVENAVLVEKGNYVILLINADVKAAEDAVNECFE